MPRCRNPECKQEVPEGANYCGEDCFKRHQQLKHQQFKDAFPESTKVFENNEKAVKNALFDLKDRQCQAGLAWRMKQCEAVRVLDANGWSKQDILREFRRNGMTVSTANRIIDDALC